MARRGSRYRSEGAGAEPPRVCSYKIMQDAIHGAELSLFSTRARRYPHLLGVPEERRRPVDAMHELAVGHRDEERQDHTEVDSEQNRHGARGAKGEQEETGYGCEE